MERVPSPMERFGARLLIASATAAALAMLQLVLDGIWIVWTWPVAVRWIPGLIAVQCLRVIATAGLVALIALAIGAVAWRVASAKASGPE